MTALEYGYFSSGWARLGDLGERVHELASGIFSKSGSVFIFWVSLRFWTFTINILENL
jgi:hypothetical protein